MVDFCYQGDEKSLILFTSLCSIFNGIEMDRNIRIIFISGLDFLKHAYIFIIQIKLI